MTYSDDNELPPLIKPQDRFSATGRVLDAREQIMQGKPDRNDFLHTVLCQVGMPRRKTPERTFERQSGHVSVLLEAGKLWDGRAWKDLPLPYGTTPRLVMVHVSSEAVRTQCRTIEVGDSVRQFLLRLGMGDGGGPRGGYTVFRQQIESLAACRLSIGMQSEGRVITVDAKPIKRFEAWLNHDGAQRTLWPGVLELSAEFYETLTRHAVPLDYRALAALRHSSLGLDLYTWLAHRLCRISRPQGVKLSWNNLREQFGQEYKVSKDFKREFRNMLRQVCAVYPEARISDVIGGIQLHYSPAPMSATRISLAGLKRIAPTE